MNSTAGDKTPNISEKDKLKAYNDIKLKDLIKEMDFKLTDKEF